MKLKLNKALIVVLVLSVLSVLLFFMKRTAEVSREKSDKILEEFKKVDESLQKSADSLQRINKN